MRQSRKWKSLGWEGPLLLLGVLAGGAFIAASSCNGSRAGGVARGAEAGAGGSARTTASAVTSRPPRVGLSP